MNERIKERVLQAGFNPPNPLVEGQNGPGVVTERDKLVELVELIVRECAGKVDWILAEGGKTQGDLIKEHFGVEE